MGTGHLFMDTVFVKGLKKSQWIKIYSGWFRIPLFRGKSARQALEEVGLYEEYKAQYPQPRLQTGLELSNVPLTFDPQVSVAITAKTCSVTLQTHRSPFHISLWVADYRVLPTMAKLALEIPRNTSRFFLTPALQTYGYLP